MDFKGTDDKEKEMIITTTDHHQLQNIQYPIPMRQKQNPPISSRYRECMKNHAASTGGNVVDGCGEFMPAGEEGTGESLKCAACNCHRNFHRREAAEEMGFEGGIMVQLPPPRVRMGFGGTESSSEEMNLNSKKRFRTKFTQEQKEKMLEFAEKVGWRIPREDDAEARRFCVETGVKRHVLKVWMHNNNKLAKKDQN